MPACYEMSVDERRKYLRLVQPRYLAGDRPTQSRLLEEMEAVTGLHRKSLIRLLHEPTLDRQPRHKQRGRRYGCGTEDVIRVVWESLDYLCAERLTPGLLATAQHLAQFGELVLTSEVEAQLGQISRPTVQRFLTRLSQDRPRLPRRGPEAANRIGREIPMGRLPWETTEPGHFEVDLVHHCGTATVGDYVHTLQLVDVATGWSERVAILGRSQRAMEEGFRHILQRLPFPIRQLHPDNGTEFLNDHLIRFWGEQIVGLKLSRSRPYHKNDNRFVEQKNDTLVRAYFGQVRFDSAVQCQAMNVLYDQMWLYYNLYQPVMHLVSKEAKEGRLKRQWDEAQTPYQRLLSKGVLAEAEREKLATLYGQTNPRQSRQQIYQALGKLRDEPELAIAQLQQQSGIAGKGATEERRGGLGISGRLCGPAHLSPGPTTATTALPLPSTSHANTRPTKETRKEAAVPSNIII